VIQRKLGTINPAEAQSTANNALWMQLGYCYEWAGKPEESKAAFQRALQAFKPTPNAVVGPEALGAPEFVALTYAGLGDKENALAQAKQAVADYKGDAVNLPPAETALAQIQARFGDIDAAIAAIPHLLEVPSGITVADLKMNPLWNPLRNDPRFQKLISEHSPDSK
jgi:tetratricopeptide (TPR) repeat protein